MTPWFDQPVETIAALPAFMLPLIVFASAALEYVIPPYWGDTLILVGFYLAGEGAVSMATVFLAALAGSCVGALISYQLGYRFGLAMTRWVTFERQRRKLESLQEMLAQAGERALAVNRFVPVIRGLFLYGAGATGLRFKQSMLYAGLSNLAWTALLMAVGVLTAGAWDQLMGNFQYYSRLIGGGLLGLAGLWCLGTLWRGRTGSLG